MTWGRQMGGKHDKGLRFRVSRASGLPTFMSIIFCGILWDFVDISVVLKMIRPGEMAVHHKSCSITDLSTREKGHFELSSPKTNT